MIYRFALLLTVVFIGLATVTATEAHSRPVRLTPEPGAVLEASPAEVRGWFTSDIRRDDGSFIRVLDATNARVDASETQLAADRRSMSVALRPDLPGGAYLVHWSTYDDADDEVFGGCYLFYVGQAAADAAIADGRAMDGAEGCPENAPAHQASVALDVETSGNSATVQITPTNFINRAPDGSTRSADGGHYHIYLDKAPLDVVEGHSHSGDEGASHHGGGAGSGPQHPSGLLENPVQWFDNSYTFNNLAPGSHTVAVALFYDDHTPLSPPVLAETTFNIEGVGGDGSGVPVWALILGLAVAHGGGIAVGKLVAGGRGE